MDRAQATRYFTDSAAAMLAGFTAALFLGNVACLGLTQPRDPLLGMPMDAVFWIAGLGALAVVLVCLYATQPRLKLALVLWFAANGIGYRLGLHWVGVTDLSGYVSALAGVFHLSGGLATGLLGGLLLYLFTGSASLLAWGTVTSMDEAALKATCAHCGGHTAFSPRNVGQIVPCPHCQTALTLRPPESLKMSCFFCQGHIEFPRHALGRKVACPHCKRSLTLQLPEPGS